MSASAQSAGLGRRIRELRAQQGLGQAELAGERLSPSYISLIESGRRSPEWPVVVYLAGRLGTTPEFLQTGIEPDRIAERRLRLQFAELALVNGSAGQARDRFRELLDAPDPDLRFAALWGLSRAEKALGNVDRSLDHLNTLIDMSRQGASGPPGLLVLLMQQCRLYAEAGDLEHSIALGEQSLEEARQLGLEGTDDEIRLATSLVAGYWGRGDLLRAHRLATEVIARAERSGSRRSRGSIYWNASLLAETRGDNGRALELAQKALALMAEDSADRELARLRVTFAWVLLRSNPPDVARARELLERAHAVLSQSSYVLELASCESELARCLLLSGQVDDAVRIARCALDRLSGQETVEKGRVRLNYGLALVAHGQSAEGLPECRAAAAFVQRSGSRFEAARMWREIAEVQSRLGLTDAAVESLCRMADCIGVRAPASVIVRATEPSPAAASAAAD
jgi:transcriptional regulator with XRE-family HTH domain